MIKSNNARCKEKIFRAPVGDKDRMVIIQGGLTSFSSPLSSPVRVQGHTPKPGTKKAVAGFSKRSRINLMKKMAVIVSQIPFFITLTYHHPISARESKKHLEAFRKRLERRFPRAWFVWKMEPQKRGVPHFHLLGDHGDKMEISEFRQWVSNTWWECCGKQSEEHRKAGTNVKEIPTGDDPSSPKSKIKRLVCYLSKYFNKEINCDEVAEKYGCDQDLWKDPGRFWGFIGKENIQESDKLFFEVGESEFFQLRRIVRRWLRRRASAYSKRLRYCESFFILADPREIMRAIGYTTGGCEFFITKGTGSP